MNALRRQESPPPAIRVANDDAPKSTGVFIMPFADAEEEALWDEIVEARRNAGR